MPSFLRLPAVVLLVLAVMPGVAGAQSRNEAPPERSPGLALGLSAGLPLAGYAMIAAAVLPSGNIQAWQKVSMVGGIGLALLGPSGGNYYTGRFLPAFAFSAGRLTLAALGAMFLQEGIGHSDVSEADYQPGAAKTSMIEVAACGAGILALSVWESLDSYVATKRRNPGNRRPLALAPLMIPGREGKLVTGLGVAGTY